MKRFFPSVHIWLHVSLTSTAFKRLLWLARSCNACIGVVAELPYHLSNTCHIKWLELKIIKKKQKKTETFVLVYRSIDRSIYLFNTTNRLTADRLNLIYQSLFP